MTDVIAGGGQARLAGRHPSLAHLRRRGGVLVGALALMLGCAMALAPEASASPPVSIPAPIGNTNTYPAGIACPFTLQTTLIGGNQVLTFFDDGRFLATGRHIDRLTNVDTGTSITLNLNGIVSQVPTADGGSVLRAIGITSFIFFPGDAGPGEPRPDEPTSSSATSSPSQTPRAPSRRSSRTARARTSARCST